MEQLLAAEPEDEALRLALARAQLAVHRYAAALELARPLGDAARAERARALFHLTRYEEALGWLDGDAPDETLMAADALEALGRYGGPEGADGAVDRAARALGADHPQVALLRARRHERHGRDAEAVADYRAALAADPLERAALFGLGRALLNVGELEEGRALLERHRALMPLFDRLDDARRKVDLAPAHGPNHAALGDALRALEVTDEAEAAYRRALELTGDGQRVPVALRLARLLCEDRDDLERAVALLSDEAALQDARPTPTTDPRLSVRAGDYLMEAGRGSEALLHYLRAERLRPEDPAVAERVARARRAAGFGGGG